MIKKWFFIHDRNPGKGSWNMAVDDYLFRNLDDRPQTFLRFYTWKKPTVSLGYSQKSEKVLNEEFCRKNDIEVVRRITGGKLVLHFREVTYSICSSDTKLFTNTLKGSYRLISEALITGLREMGINASLSTPPPSAYIQGDLPCFSYPAENEIEVKGRKVVGSAQKRKNSKFLQHGSIPLVEEEDLLRAVSKLEDRREKVRMICLSEAMNQNIDYNQAVSFLSKGMEEYFSVSLRSFEFSAEQQRQIKALQKNRHENPEWIHRK